MRISDWSSDVCSSDLLEWAAESEVAALRSGDVAVFSADIDAEEKVIALIHCRSNASDAREALKTEVAGILRMRHGVDATIVLIPPHSLPPNSPDRKSAGSGKSGAVRVDLGGGR